MFPPSVLRIRVRDNDHNIGLWLPLILVWPLVVLVDIVLSPLILLLSLILWPSGYGKPLLFAGPLVFRLFCALRGLTVSVEQRSERVLVYFK